MILRGKILPALSAGRIVALLLVLYLSLLAVGCAMTEEKLEDGIARQLAKMDGFYAELDAVIYSTEGNQSYQVKQWLDLPARWRVEVDSEGEAQIFICDGEQVYLYQPEIGDYFRLSGDAASELSPPFLLSSYLEEFLQAQNRTFMGKRSEEGKSYYLVSYEVPNRNETVHLHLDEKQFFPVWVETYIHDQLLNQLTTRSFTINPKTDQGLFEYDASAQEEVISQCIITPLSLDEAKNDWPYPVYTPDYLPEGCFLFVISQSEEDGQDQLIFIYKGEEHFSFVQRPKSETTFYKAESTQELKVNDHVGYYHANKDGGLSTLWWANEKMEFMISGSLSQDELVRVAASVREDQLF